MENKWEQEDVLDIVHHENDSFNMEVNKLSADEYVFVDIQGFKTYKERFIIKEFCMLVGDYMFHTTVKSPYCFQKLPPFYKRQATMLTNRFHGLSFDSGDMHICELIEKAYPFMQGKKVLVKGKAKKTWLHHIFRNCDDINCINIEDLYGQVMYVNEKMYPNCGQHMNNLISHCAFSNALKLKDKFDSNN